MSVKNRWRDHSHTLQPAESGAGNQTILDIAGDVSMQMLKHYSHIRMKPSATRWRQWYRKNWLRERNTHSNTVLENSGGVTFSVVLTTMDISEIGSHAELVALPFL